MVSFTDGPAAGVVLELRRAPLLLRAVQGADGWDALDQLNDVPAPGEAITVYRRVGAAGSVHLCSRGKQGRGCRVLAVAEYALCPTQPDDATARDTALWRQWAQAQARQEEG